MLLFAPFMGADPAETVFREIRRSLGSGERRRIEGLFARPENAACLFEAAKRGTPLPQWKASVFPAPPGWESRGVYWVVFHTRQSIEQDHDPIYPLVSTADGLRLGHEIGEAEEGGNRILKATNDVHLLPKANRAEVAVDIELAGTGEARADVLRLQDLYAVSNARIDGKARKVVAAGAESIPHPKSGDLLRAGGLLIPWSTAHARSLRLAYGAKLPKGKGLDEDRVDDRAAYLTAWWVPSAGRLPFRSETRVTAPKEWVVRSEGVAVSNPEGVAFPAGRDESLTAYRCDVPISYPKVVAGRYELAASLNEGGRLFRSYQFAPVDTKRAEGDVRSAADAIRFFEKALGPFPFPGYDVLDGDAYYGIESYSYTLLDPKITPWATTHEIGHTYFGGLVPCPYVRDSWNEGVTQYVDSVLFKHNSDGTLQGALRQTGLYLPLTAMPVPYAEDGATYYRGAYAMTMLAHEIGEEKVLAGLRAIVSDRRGLDTVWADLRPYFERAGGRDLGWFWNQWIEGTAWPKLEIASANVQDGTRTRIVVAQSGTPKTMRLRFVVRLSGEGKTKDAEVTLDEATHTFDLTSGFKPDEARLEILGYVFGTTGPKAKVLPLER